MTGAPEAERVGLGGDQSGDCWGCFAAHRRQAGSYRDRDAVQGAAGCVGAGLPAMDRAAVPCNLTGNLCRQDTSLVMFASP